MKKLATFGWGVFPVRLFRLFELDSGKIMDAFGLTKLDQDDNSKITATVSKLLLPTFLFRSV